jgi:hypothetical protein
MAWYFNPFTGNFDYYVVGSAPAPAVDNLLMETGDQLLFEDNSAIQLEA